MHRLRLRYACMRSAYQLPFHSLDGMLRQYHLHKQYTTFMVDGIAHVFLRIVLSIFASFAAMVFAMLSGIFFWRRWRGNVFRNSLYAGIKKMQEFDVIVDFNGIVIVDCAGLQDFYGGIAEGTNLYEKFIQSDDGDEVVRLGIVVPIMGINDSIYKVFIRMADEASLIPEGSIFLTNAAFPLAVTGRLIIADMAVLLEWNVGEGWQDIAIPAGWYSVALHGYRKIVENVVVDFGYEIVFTPTTVLPQFTGSLTQDMQVLTLPG